MQHGLLNKPYAEDLGGVPLDLLPREPPVHLHLGRLLGVSDLLVVLVEAGLGLGRVLGAARRHELGVHASRHGPEETKFVI